MYREMVSYKQKAQIIMLRGLGYDQSEIADKLDLSINQVSYNLREIQEEAQEEGDQQTYLRYMADGYLPEIIDTLEKARTFL